MLRNHQLKDLVNHHLAQSFDHTQVHQVFHHNKQVQHIRPLQKHLKLYNLLHTQVHLDFHYSTLQVGLTILQVRHKYQTYQIYLMQLLKNLQRVDGKSLLHLYTLDHLAIHHNLLAPNHLPKHSHHKHGKIHKRLLHYHPYILHLLDCHSNNYLLHVDHQKTLLQHPYLLHSHLG